MPPPHLSPLQLITRHQSHKPFTNDSPASAARPRCQAWGPGGTGELGEPRRHPKLPPPSHSPSLTSSSGAAAGKGFVPEPVWDGSRIQEKQVFPSEEAEVFQGAPLSPGCPPPRVPGPPQDHQAGQGWDPRVPSWQRGAGMGG